MATSTTAIKQEKIDADFEELLRPPGNAAFVHYGNSTASSPTDADSTTATPDLMPPLKRMRYPNKETLQNGHTPCDPCKLGLSDNYEHYEASHAHALLMGLSLMRDRKELVDVVFVVEGQEIFCHSVVLSSASQYFARLFTSNGLDFHRSHKQQQRVQLAETSYGVIKQLVDYTYTSRIQITSRNIKELMSTAKFFQFATVCSACVNVLKQRLNPQTCVAIRRFANEQGCSELEKSAYQFTCDHFSDVSANESFLDLTVGELTALFSSSKLNVNDEESVYEAAMTWVQHDVTRRSKHLPEVLRHVRLPLVKPHFLLDVVENDPLIKANKGCDKSLDEARRFQMLADQRPLMQSCRTQPRSTYSSQKCEVLVVVGGLNKDKVPVSDCVFYNFPKPGVKHLAPLQVNQTAYSVATIGNNIFVTGGAVQSPYKDVWMYIPSLNTWQQVSPMMQARYLHASVGLDGCLYVIGGHNGSRRLRSVERYDPNANLWHKIDPMSKELSSPCAVACDGLLYVIGGAKGALPEDIVCDVQFYNPKTRAWNAAAPLPQPERGALAANLNGTIYVMGQHCRVHAYNKKNNAWVSMCNSQGGHLHGATAVHKGKLYIAGGLHGNSFINGTVEVYDQLNNSWQVISTLHAPIYAQGFVSIFKDVVVNVTAR